MPALQLSMTEFYKRYSRLFTDADHIHKNQSVIATLNNNYKTPNNNPLIRLFQNEGGHRWEQLGRSPALDKFQHYILPRLKTEYGPVDRQDKEIMLSPQSSPYSRIPNISIDSKSNRLKDRKRQEAKHYINASKKLQNQESFNNNSNKKYAYPSIKTQKYDLQSIKQQIVNQTRLEKTPQPIIYTKRTINFTTNETNKISQAEEQTKKINKLRNIYESQLYGINQNPYAFANSKLSDIKLIQRFYPRGIINQYKVCLHRRHQKKNQIDQRKQRLRQLLEKDRNDFISASK